jgi:hypothetical protein
MKVIKIVDLDHIIKHFEEIYAQNGRLSNVWDGYVSDASGRTFIDELRAIRQQAMVESKGRLAAYISDELFVKYTQVILDPKLKPEMQAYKAIFDNLMPVCKTNRFIKYMDGLYSHQERSKFPQLSNLVFDAARTRDKDLVWEALNRLMKANVKLNAVEIGFILENRECAMGLSMCFAEFSKSKNRQALASAFALAFANNEDLRMHLQREENYNYQHFYMHPMPILEQPRGVVAAVRTLRQSGKQMEVADLLPVFADLDACNEYAQAVRLLHTSREPFDEESKAAMMELFASNPERSMPFILVTRHIRRVSVSENKPVRLQSDHLHQLSNDELVWLSAMLKGLHANLHTSDNIARLYQSVRYGAYLVPLLPCLSVKAGDRKEQERFDLLMQGLDHVHRFADLPLLTAHPRFSAHIMTFVLRQPEYADKLISGFMIWMHGEEKHGSRLNRNNVSIRYKGDLQDSARRLSNHFHTTQLAMLKYPEQADEIARRAVLEVQLANPHRDIKSVESIISDLGLGEDKDIAFVYNPSMFRSSSKQVLPDNSENEREELRRSFN